MKITEALQEIKTINSRILKKQSSIGNYTARDSRVVDPLIKNGGSEQFIKREMQAISDLRKRLVEIRSAIQAANLSNTLSINGVEDTVANWLTWRREVAPGHKAFVDSILMGIRKIRSEAQNKGGRTATGMNVTVENFTPQDPPTIVVNVDEHGLMQEQEFIETALGTLDGKLSMFNATTEVIIS